jgi:hypothetical protein
MLAVSAGYPSRQDRLDAKQRRCPGGRRMSDQASWISACHDAASVHHGNPAAKRERLVKLVRDQDRRRPRLVEPLAQRR